MVALNLSASGCTGDADVPAAADREAAVGDVLVLVDKCVYTHIYIYVYINIYILHIHICIYTYKNTCSHIFDFYIYIYIYICIFIHMSKWWPYICLGIYR